MSDLVNNTDLIIWVFRKEYTEKSKVIEALKTLMNYLIKRLNRIINKFFAY